MPATDVLSQLRGLGVTVAVAGDKLSLEPASRIPPELLAAVRECKLELLRLLRPPTPREVADELEEMCRLGARMKRGEIAAVRCGITGQRCTACQGVPCLGSMSWTEATIPASANAEGVQGDESASGARE